MSLYWSTVSSYLLCAQGHLWDRGAPGIDLGAGEGKPKPVPDKDRSSDHWSIQGVVLARIVEDFYNEELWRWPDELEANIERRLPSYLLAASDKRWIDPRFASARDVENNIRDGISGFLKIVKAERLLGEVAESEVLLEARLPNGVKVGGHPDILLKTGDRVQILDGKNSLRLDNDPDQLRWYAMVLKYDRGWDVTRMGFLYFRYPPDNPPKSWKSTVPWTGVLDVPHASDGFAELERKALIVKRGLEAKEFPASPSPKACKYCDHKASCKEYQERPRRQSKRTLPIAKDVLPEGVLTWE